MVTSDRNGKNSPERDGIVEETSVNAEKLVVDCSREEQVQTSEVAGSDLVKKKSHDDEINKERSDSTTLSKRKMNFVVDLDAPAIDSRRDVCTSSSDNLHLSSGCKTSSVFKRCAACSKRQRYISTYVKSFSFLVFVRFLILGIAKLNSRLSKYKLLRACV